MKALSIVVAVAFFSGGSSSVLAAGPALAGRNTIVEGLLGISGALTIHPGTIASLTKNVVPIGQDALAGGLNALGDLPGLSGLHLGGQKGSNDPLLGVQAIPAIGSNVAVLIKELPTYVPSVVKDTVPSVINDVTRMH